MHPLSAEFRNCLSRACPFSACLTSTLLFCVIGVVLQLEPKLTHAQSTKPTLLQLSLRSRVPAESNPRQYQFKFENQSWKPAETAIIVCDFWDYHHCLNAVRRMKEFGPRLNRVINQARGQGITIIHSPSDCMPAYRDHPARLRATAVPFSPAAKEIQSWCSRIPAEAAASYPIDQSDGGEDDDPAEHQAWATKLKSLGRNPNMPWAKQNEMIPINAKRDFISDDGQEVWNILQARQIKNVILVGVHTNMCVLGRPFGLRQMKRNGMNVVLMRDMTDTMYNPQRWPFVSHHAGTDLIISHIEKYVCPTISSDQLIGGPEFFFPSDPRPHLAIVIGEQEYETKSTLPEFAENHLRDFRVSFVHANPLDRNDFPGLQVIKNADLLLLSVRRRVLMPQQMKLFKDFEAAGKPILGIRTASHAFSLRNQDPPEGYVAWPEFDSEVFGGSYTNHHGNKLKSKVVYTEVGSKHVITRRNAYEPHSLKTDKQKTLKTFGQSGSLYKTAPIAQGAEILMQGSVLGHPAQPVAWTFKRVNGGKSFYTSMGHPLDFENSEFVDLLRNAIDWAAEMETPQTASVIGPVWRTIETIKIPKRDKGKLKFAFESRKELKGLHTYVGFRKVVRIPAKWCDQELKLVVPDAHARCWLNGLEVSGRKSGEKTKSAQEFILPQKAINRDEANWLMIGMKYYVDEESSSLTPELVSQQKRIKLGGKWEWTPARAEFVDSSKISLPAKFGGSTDVFMELPR